MVFPPSECAELADGDVALADGFCIGTGGDDAALGVCIHVQNIIDKYESLYPDFEEKKDEDTGLLDKNSKKKYSITMSSIDTETLYLYTSKYSFLTDSKAFDENYIYTDYTSDRGNIVIVTYTKGNHQVKFLLNYNIYTVEVRIGDETYKLSKYDYIRIEG